MLDEALAALYAANLGPMAERLKTWVGDSANQRKSHTACVEALVEALLQHRLDSRTRSFRRRAVLPDHVALATVRADDARGLTEEQLGNLGTCDWVRQGHTLVVTGPILQHLHHLGVVRVGAHSQHGLDVHDGGVPLDQGHQWILLRHGCSLD